MLELRARCCRGVNMRCGRLAAIQINRAAGANKSCRQRALPFGRGKHVLGTALVGGDADPVYRPVFSFQHANAHDLSGG